jgi:hypothetical protein
MRLHFVRKAKLRTLLAESNMVSGFDGDKRHCHRAEIASFERDFERE